MGLRSNRKRSIPAPLPESVIGKAFLTLAQFGPVKSRWLSDDDVLTAMDIVFGLPRGSLNYFNPSELKRLLDSNDSGMGGLLDLGHNEFGIYRAVSGKTWHYYLGAPGEDRPKGNWMKQVSSFDPNT